MCATPFKPRLTWLAIVAVTGATALSVAACGTSNNENTGKSGTSASSPANPTSSAPKPQPAPPAGNDHVEGLVRSVSGNTIQLTRRDRTATTVDFTPTTLVTEVSSAALSDVTPNSCVDVKASPQSGPPGGAITAQSVEVNPAEGGNCPPPEQPTAGSPGAPPPAPPSGESPSVYGTVSSVTGNTIAVTSTDPTGKTTDTNVTVIDTTTYVKHVVTNTRAVQQGKCIAAQGTNSGGVLQAATIDLEPCPPMGREHRHHLHHHHHR